MSDKKNPFEIKPTAEFRNRVLESAESLLEKNRKNAKASEGVSWSRRWIWMSGLGLTLSGAIGVLFVTKNDSMSEEDQSVAMVDPELLENEDLLADLELLEELDDLEAWEES